MVSVYGSDASARATPNSACTGGSATTTDNMPTPPIVDSSSAITSRVQAYVDSASPSGTVLWLFFVPADCRSVLDCVIRSPQCGLLCRPRLCHDRSPAWLQQTKVALPN